MSNGFVMFSLVSFFLANTLQSSTTISKVGYLWAWGYCTSPSAMQLSFLLRELVLQKEKVCHPVALLQHLHLSQNLISFVPSFVSQPLLFGQLKPDQHFYCLRDSSIIISRRHWNREKKCSHFIAIGLFVL